MSPAKSRVSPMDGRRLRPGNPPALALRDHLAPPAHSMERGSVQSILPHRDHQPMEPYGPAPLFCSSIASSTCSASTVR